MLAGKGSSSGSRLLLLHLMGINMPHTVYEYLQY
jgi:hypothetical protein